MLAKMIRKNDAIDNNSNENNIYMNGDDLRATDYIIHIMEALPLIDAVYS